MRKFVFLLLSAIFLPGCGPQAITPAQKEDQSERMLEILRGTSPRNLNGEPKAVVEFRTQPKQLPGKEIEERQRPEVEEKW